MSVTEDYCSFEVAKLLKEKGFDENIKTCYHNNKFWEYSCNKTYNGDLFKFEENEYSAPTHQMAMKWLREIHGLNVQVCIVQTIELKKAYNATIYSNACEQLKAYFGRNIFDGFKSYEEAVEAAIKYCLTNLI